MSNQSAVASAVPLTEPKRLAFFERYLTVWVLGCMVVGVAFGKAAAGCHCGLEQAGIRAGIAGERADWGAAVADDLPNDVEGGFRRDWGDCATAKGADGDAVRQLAGEAVQHGVARLDLHATRLRRLDWPRDGQAIHRRTHHPGRRALHRHGLRLVLPHRWRSRPILWCRWR